MNEKKIRVYGAGGCGINIVSGIQKLLDAGRDTTYPDIEVSYIDTSFANIKEVPNGLEKFYHVKGSPQHPTDGSGMVRSTNYPAIRNSINDIIAKFPPGDLNIVIHSAGGGTGSVAGVVLAAELLKDNKQVIVILVGSKTCGKEISNTLDTIESYVGQAQRLKKPIICRYLENKNTSQSEVDLEARTLVLVLSAMLSDNVVARLDTRDVDNFLNYHNVTTMPATLAFLELTTDWPDLKSLKEKQDKGIQVASMLSLIEKGSDHPEFLVSYHTFGEVKSEVVERIQLAVPVSLAVLVGEFNHRCDALRKLQVELESRQKASQALQLEVNANNLDDFGMKF